MTNETQATPKKPTWKQAVTLLGAGIVLSASGCATWINYVGGASHDELTTIGAIAFFVGVAVFIVGMYRAWKMVTLSDGPTRKGGLILFWAGIALVAGGWPALQFDRITGIAGDAGGLVFCGAGALLTLFGAVLLLERMVRRIAQRRRER
jgi:hypothetical protein